MQDETRPFTGPPATLSIVVPTYFNALNIPETIPRLLSLREPLQQLGLGLELIFVDDGSGDETRALLDEFHLCFPDVISVARLTRNFGSMAAIHAGLSLATGECVGMIAADLQDPPELFLEMAAKWRAGSKAILAIRADREESRSQKLFSNAYYSLIRRFAMPEYPAGGFDFFVVDRQVVRDLLRINEKNTNLMSLIFWLGYTPALIPYVRKKRDAGVSRWTLRKKVKLFIDSFVAFSYAPIRILSVLGLLFAVGSFVYGGFVFLVWLLRDIPVRGFTPVIVTLTFTAGLQMMMLGVLGEYLWRALDETRGRPAFVIDSVRGRQPAMPAEASHDLHGTGPARQE